ncbi:RHS repeat protein, partial [Candidatus Woesearchaeota archaeon]|nr:RHS repeat protein [Candidatus Woesearchaeota archaeon]
KYTYSFDGVAPESVKVSLRTTANNTQDITYYYDGMANLVQLKTDVEDGQQIVKNIFYDSQFRVGSEQNPYFAATSAGLSNSSGASNTTYTYDALDRVIGVRNTDGTSKNITFDRFDITDFDENSNKHKYTLDGLGRISHVYEYNTNDVGLNETYITTYNYDSNDNLITITDTLGNVFSFTYDSLSRKTAMTDPDLGRWQYAYNTNGNLITQTDARNQTITLAYDVLNRVLRKVYVDNGSSYNISFGYDKDYYGTLTNISLPNASFSFDYDDRLRVITQRLTVEGVAAPTDFVYDSQDRILSEASSSVDVDYLLNKLGRTKKIPGFINDSRYSAFGSVLNRTFGNNLVASFSYNVQNNRLTNIAIPNVQNLSYTYDSVGNILTINDVTQGKLHTMTYDNLDRMRTATIGSDRYVYSFNPTGNVMKIVKNNVSKKFVYQGNQSHAPSRI